MSPETVSQIIGAVFVSLIGLLVVLSMRGKKLVLAGDEKKLARIFAETKQLKFGGFMIVGSPYEGQLSLTNKRLVYTNPSEQKTSFSLGPTDITSIAKGQKGTIMSLELSYTDAKGKPRRASFRQLAAITGMNIDPTKELPIGMFIDRVMAWREGRPMPGPGVMPGPGAR